MDYQPWYLGEPNGGDQENCGQVWPSRKGWNDRKCRRLLCGFCELDHAPVFTLRGNFSDHCGFQIFTVCIKIKNTLVSGLCLDSQFDSKYSWTRELEENFYVFRGYNDGILKYNASEELWTLILYSKMSTYATVNMTEYPFGEQKWTIHNDPCFGPGQVEVTLNLNACNDHEFNCVNGQCIPMTTRCDGILDCKDKSGMAANSSANISSSSYSKICCA